MYFVFTVLGTAAACPIGFGGFCHAPGLDRVSRSYNDLVHHVAVYVMEENGAPSKEHGEILFLSCTLSSTFPSPSSGSSSAVSATQYYRQIFVALLSFIRAFFTGWLRIKSSSPPPPKLIKMMHKILLQPLVPQQVVTEPTAAVAKAAEEATEAVATTKAVEVLATAMAQAVEDAVTAMEVVATAEPGEATEVVATTAKEATEVVATAEPVEATEVVATTAKEATEPTEVVATAEPGEATEVVATTAKEAMEVVTLPEEVLNISLDSLEPQEGLMDLLLADLGRDSAESEVSQNEDGEGGLGS
jgi:hypothetical protein